MACMASVTVTGPNGGRIFRFENCEPLLTLTTAYLPSRQPLPGMPEGIAHVIIMFHKECAAVIPLIDGLSFGYGGELQASGYYDIVQHKPVVYHGLIITITFRNYAQTTEYPHDRPCYFRGDRTRIGAQEWVFEGRSDSISLVAGMLRNKRLLKFIKRKLKSVYRKGYLWVDYRSHMFAEWQATWFYGPGDRISHVFKMWLAKLQDLIRSTPARAQAPVRPHGMNYLILRHHIDHTCMFVPKNGPFCSWCLETDHISKFCSKMKQRRTGVNGLSHGP